MLSFIAGFTIIYGHPRGSDEILVSVVMADSLQKLFWSRFLVQALFVRIQGTPGPSPTLLYAEFQSAQIFPGHGLLSHY